MGRLRCYIEDARLDQVEKLGLASSYTRLSDMIVLFEGGSVPYVIRPQGNVYKLVGEALVADYLEGYRSINHSEVRTITLI
jgi:hypothetical protein